MHSTASSIIMKLSCIKVNWKARGYLYSVSCN
jgi:hypothetical protein